MRLRDLVLVGVGAAAVLVVRLVTVSLEVVVDEKAPTTTTTAVVAAEAEEDPWVAAERLAWARLVNEGKAVTAPSSSGKDATRLCLPFTTGRLA